MTVVIEPNIARWRYAETGKSTNFKQWFDLLRTEERYTSLTGQKALGELELILTFRPREFTKLVYQLCHWIKGLDGLASQPNGWLNAVFGLERPVSSAAFRHHLKTIHDSNAVLSDAPVSLEGNDLVIHYPDHDEGGFKIAFGRMPLLMAFLDLLLPTELYGELSSQADNIIGQPWQHEAVRPCVNALVGTTSQFLDSHLRTAQAVDKFNQLVGFLETRSNDEFLHFTDENLLAYWLKGMEPDSDLQDIILFKRLFLEFVYACHALREGETLAVGGNTISIGSDIDAGEIDIDAATAYDAMPQGGYESPLTAFGQEPLKQTKLVNDTDRTRLHLLMECGPLALKFSRSLMRAHVFGYIQSEIVAAQQNHDPEALQKHLTLSAIHREPTGNVIEHARNYSQQVEQYKQLTKRVDLRVRALGRMLLEDGDLDFSAFDDDTQDQREAVETAMSRNRGAVASVMQGQSFVRAMEDEDFRSLMQDAIQPMIRIRSQIDEFLAHASSGVDDARWNQLTDEDVDSFRRAFMQHYGEVQ